MECYFVDLDQTQIKLLLRLYTKDKSVWFCFKLLFFVQETTNFTELLQQLILLINEAKLLISIMELFSEENLIWLRY